MVETFPIALELEHVTDPAQSLVRAHSAQALLMRRDFRDKNEFATVVVGTGATAATFSLHRHVLVTVSPFFASALNSTFMEGIEQKVSLPEERADVFEWFVWWLYTGSLVTSATTNNCRPSGGANTDVKDGSCDCKAQMGAHCKRASNGSTTSPHSDGDLRNKSGMPKFVLLLEIYKLSDILMTTTLSNHVLDTIARLSDMTNSVPTPSDTCFLYEDMGPQGFAPIRKLILDLFTYKKTDKLIDSHADDWHPRFLRDLVVRLKRPEKEFVERHALVVWKCTAWAGVKSCDGECGEVIRPRTSTTGNSNAEAILVETIHGKQVLGGAGAAVRCVDCARTYCVRCVQDGTLGKLRVEAGGCKPWSRGFCARYHIH